MSVLAPGALSALDVHRGATSDDPRGRLGVGVCWGMGGAGGERVGDGWGVVSGADLSGRVLSMMYLDFVVKMEERALHRIRVFLGLDDCRRCAR